MFSISVCMIVKDEELVIERALHCVSKFADEIIIVDTGSKDRTKEICKKFNTNIFDFKWCNDFSKARNFSFSKATKDYIMWLDADDFISETNIEKINKLKYNKQDIDVYMFKYVMSFEDNKPTFEFFRERLLKRSKHFEFQGFVHEVITPSGKIQYEDISIEHRKEKENPTKRNLKLYRDAIKRGIKFNPREQYYYSRELFYNFYYKKCIKELKKYLNMKDNYTPNIKGAYLLLCDSYLYTNNPKLALKNIFDSIRLYTPNSETCCMVAKIYENLNDTNQAIFWYNIALIAPNTSEGFIQKKYSDFIPYLELCKLYYKIDYNESKKYFLLAKNINPTNKIIKYNEQFFKI